MEHALKDEKILGLCGRQNAGKSSIAIHLTGQSHPQYDMIIVNDPFKYVVDTVFGPGDGNSRDTVWDLTRGQQESMLRDMILNFVDSKWFSSHPVGNIYKVPVDVISNKQQWVEMSFAWSLKKICSVIFDVPFEILLGITEEAREIRETETHGHRFNRVPKIPFTGRVILEYFGTDVLRNHFDPNIWLNILRREAQILIRTGIRVVIPDVRFENEFQFLQKMNASLLVVYRTEKDLELTKEDKETHIAKWHFLIHYPKVSKHILINNSKTLDDLRSRVDQLVKS